MQTADFIKAATDYRNSRAMSAGAGHYYKVMTADQGWVRKVAKCEDGELTVVVRVSLGMITDAAIIDDGAKTASKLPRYTWKALFFAIK